MRKRARAQINSKYPTKEAWFGLIPRILRRATIGLCRCFLMSRLLTDVRNAIRVRQYSLSTEKAYMQWVRRYIYFYGKRHPAEMGKKEIEAFLTFLAVKRGVSPATQNQALQAILFLYLKVLEQELPWLDDVIRAKPRRRVPVVLSVAEVRALLAHCTGEASLPAAMLYGSGLRAMECLALRVGAVDLSRRTVRVHGGKGGKDRVTVLADSLVEPLEKQLDKVRAIHQQDLDQGLGCSKLPVALRRKLGKSSKRFYWQYLFPSGNLSEDPRDPGQLYRWHLHRTTLRRAGRSLAAGPASRVRGRAPLTSAAPLV